VNAPAPGQIGVVTDGAGFFPRSIQFITHSRANHTFVVADNGTVISADPEGVRRAYVTDYPTALYSNVALTADQRLRIVTWAEQRIGRPYSYLDDFLVGAEYSFRFRWPEIIRHYMDRDSEYMCSQLCAAAWAAGGLRPIAKDPCETSPADWYDFFHAQGWA
jgi:uncharacterized protein YycO